ncbi:hypothetical protein [Curtobacterium sp. RRHDQ10]|uniref:hypothetical protein n=1 Tax=Curtobacterium phyllosphaerae TaxID=3413379 RepID=UPI003BF0F1B8
MMTRLMTLMRHRDDERGMALATVIVFGTVLMLLVASMLALSTSGATKSTTDRNFQNAAAAAYAGLADYQSKLSNDNGYQVWGTTSSKFSSASGSVFQGTNNNVAFNTLASQVWASVPGSTDEFFRYEVDNSNFSAKGVLRIRVTGKAAGVTRSLVANLKGDGFINYLYFTNYESAQPAITGTNCTSDYQWQRKGTTCAPVQFAGSDTLNGPVRTNDRFTACGTTFNASVEDYDGTVNTSYNGCSSAARYNGGNPRSVGYLGLPALNAQMSQEARTDLPTSVPRPGCLYTGPTSIVLNANGTMTVNSPWTKVTQYQLKNNGDQKAADDTAASDALCGSVSALQSAAGATIPTLPSNLLYVQDVPTSNSPKNVNFWDVGKFPPASVSSTYCTTKVSSSGSVVATNQSFNNGLNYPIANEWTGSNPASTVYDCNAGDVFVRGTFSGSMTIAASGTVWLTGSVVYNNANTDILGLVGQNAVEIWNPMSCASAGNGTCYNGDTLLKRSAGAAFTINAAIASNAGTFWVQNYQYGPVLGTLTVKGSIAQNWRGIVATGGATLSSGFSKNYVYDNRLLTTAPPKFLQPVSTTYGVTTQVEVPAAYNADGSCVMSGGVCL